MTTENSDPKQSDPKQAVPEKSEPAKSGSATKDDPTAAAKRKAQDAADKAAELARTATTEPESTSSTGGEKPGVKPPWQRGDELAPETDGAAKPVGAHGGPAKKAPGKKAPAKKAPAKKKPIITGTAAPKMAESADDDKDRFVESPTRNIDRAQMKAKDLPNLDQIHATAASAPPAPAAVDGPRSAPTHIGAGGRGGSRALRATVQIRRIDPWSTLKISAILAVITFFIWMIAVAVLYLVLEGMGVWSQVNSSVGTLTTDGGGATDAIGAGTVFGWAFLIGVVDAILLTALASVGAFIYNLCADFIGGVEVTLADLD